MSAAGAAGAKLLRWRCGNAGGRPHVLTFELDGLPGATVLMEVDTAQCSVIDFCTVLLQLTNLLISPRVGDPLPSVKPRTGRTKQVRRARTPR